MSRLLMRTLMPAALPLAALFISPAASLGRDVQFMDVKPIISDKCFACHGPDAGHRKGKLRLDTFEGATAKAKSGKPAIVPGNPDASQLIARIYTTDADDIMPPSDHPKTLTAAEKEKIKAWIAAGAKYDQHWSFVPARKQTPPAVKNEKWVRSDIDRFVLAKIEAAGLTPQPEADRHTLIRRVTFDLTGLPPTPEEVTAFVNDTDEQAYEKLVDRLMASSRWGEHRARYWLDAARWGDTHGLHLDNYRESWLYREWVINAFNRNLPFDQMTLEQIAGDMLPNATVEQQIASGFNRAHVTTSEGGSIAEEVYVRNVIDRVETTGTVYLGLSLGCAVCHDHKYDPVTMKDFYSLFAFFNSLDENPLDGNAAAHPPVLRVGTPEQMKKVAEMKTQLVDARRQMNQAVAKVEYTDPGASAKAPPPRTVEVVWVDDEGPADAQEVGQWTWLSEEGEVKPFSGSKMRKATHDGLGQHFFQAMKKPVKVEPGDVFFAYVYLDPKNPPKTLMLQFNDGNWEHRVYYGDNLIQWGEDRSVSRAYGGMLPEFGKWVKLEVAASRVGISGQALVRGMAFTQYGGTVYWDKAGVQHRGQKSYVSLEAWVAENKKLADRRKNELPAPIIAALKAEKPTAEQQKALRNYFVSYVHPQTSEELRSVVEPVTSLEKRIEAMEKAMPSTLVSRETATPKPAYILVRGQYDVKGDEVTRATPEALPPMKPDMPRNRLGFAQWLISRDNPLTARVAVNNYWQQLFGTGLVKSAEDFGSQGDPPTHPELLDHLAVQFIDDGWDIKKFFRRLVTSATYRQSAKVTKLVLEKDPENRLLARGPRFRLDAEMLRDQALFVSGLLVEKLGGPSVKPWQPEGLWEAVGYTSSNTARFVADTGHEKVHRRSMYIFWKRTSAPPMMTTFDAPPREACVVRRERTNTPLQALLMLNEPQYFEAARALAELTLTHGGKSADERLRFMFFRAAGRPADSFELTELSTLLRDHLATFTAQPDRAKKVIAVGETKPDPALAPNELAAWTLVANMILNLDAVISKG